MNAIESYTLMRRAGFTHDEAINFINKGVKPNLNTNAKREAYKQLAETKGKVHEHSQP